MSKKKRALIAIGGTGGHVYPGCNLAKSLIEQNYIVELVSDKRGYKYLNDYKNFKISILSSSPFNQKNLFTIFLSLIIIFYSILRSIIFLLFNRPDIVFGMGGYASFPICMAASILNVKFIIYENNLIIGKTNKLLLPFAKKIFVSNYRLEGIPPKYENKTIEIGNIIKSEIIKYSLSRSVKRENGKLNILVLGGSQAAKVFAEILPRIFKRCVDSGIPIKIYQHCLHSQNETLKNFYEYNNMDYETFNFSNNLLKYFEKANFAITRSGSSILAELTNSNVPFISVPRPSSAEKHQLKNAIFYERKKYAFLIEEKDLNFKLFDLIKNISENNSILDAIIHNQRLYSDKNVYKNINLELKKIINEKN